MIVYRNFTLFGIACANIGSILNPSTIVSGRSQLQRIFYKVFKKVYDENTFLAK